MSPPTLAIGEHVSHAQTEQRVIVRFVSWTTYEHLLADLSNQSSTRLTPSLKPIVHTWWDHMESQSVTRWSFDACI
jgi:hypothetical protein